MTDEQVRDIVLRHLHELAPEAANRTLDLNAPLQEVGVDSLDLVDVASRSMQELGVKLARAEIVHIHTLNDLIGILRRTAEQAAASQASQAGQSSDATESAS